MEVAAASMMPTKRQGMDMAQAVRGLLYELRRIDEWVRMTHPGRHPLLNPPVAMDVISETEAIMHRRLPSDILDLYSAHDGQSAGSPNLYVNQRWMPLEEVRDAWIALCSKHRMVSLEPESEFIGKAMPRVWSPYWLPLFGSEAGDHYCVDHDPLSSDVGRIIWYLHDQPRRDVIASRLEGMFARVADGLDRGSWNLNEDYDGFSD